MGDFGGNNIPGVLGRSDGGPDPQKPQKKTFKNTLIQPPNFGPITTLVRLGYLVRPSSGGGWVGEKEEARGLQEQGSSKGGTVPMRINRYD